jgi:mono/diheme cytochrome c family protein
MQRTLKYVLVSALLGLLGLLGTSATVVAVEGNVEAGKQLYHQRCSPCHGMDGKANTPTAQALNPKPRDHTNGEYMNKLSNEHLAKVIEQGGAAVGKSPLMPPQTDLSDQQVQDIIAFVRTLAVPPYKGD